MGNPAEFEARLSKTEGDALAARHLAAAHDRDIADLGVKVDANRKAINALAEQTRSRFDEVDRRFDQVDRRFDRLEARVDRLEQKVDAGFAMTAAGMRQIVDLITPLLPPDQR